MSDSRAAPALLGLPEDWRLLGPEEADGRVRVLENEMSTDHPMSGLALEALAARGSNDDVLYRHRAEPTRLTIVHLTWSGRREPTPHFPSIEFDGTFAEFLEYERRLCSGESS